MSKYNGTFVKEDDNWNLVIDYTYYWDNGDYMQPPEAELTINSVELDGNDITKFYFDSYIDELFDEELMDYAVENKPHY